MAKSNKKKSIRFKTVEGNYATPRPNLTGTVSSNITFARGRAAANVSIQTNTNPIGVLSNTFNATGNGIFGSITTTDISFTFLAETDNTNWNATSSVSVFRINDNGASPSLNVGNVTFSNVFGGEILIIGGGGGGGGGGGVNSLPAGGGGGGGYREFSEIAFVTGSAIPIRVGAGGAGKSNGSNSILREIIAGGGGVGGAYGTTASPAPIGGSTGGGGAEGRPSADTVAGDNFGNIELYSFTNTKGGSAAGSGGGGGGGASSNGSNSPSDRVGGNGGAGRASSITGSSVNRAGGGGGGGENGAGSATDGGGNGAIGVAVASNGTANTGGGGGGSANASSVAAGGSGIVIIKIPNTYNATFSAGVTSSLSTSVSGFNIYSVTATSTTSETVTFSVA